MTENNMTADDYFNSGVAKYDKKDYNGAIEDYTKAIEEYIRVAEINPQYAYAYERRGLAKFKKQDYDDAIVDYDKAIKIDDTDILAYYNRGDAKFKKQDYNGAIADYTKAIELKPRFSELKFEFLSSVYYDRGLAKYNQKDYDGAIEDYTKAIELKPRFSKAYNNRGMAKDEKQEYDGAIEDYTQAIKINPEDADAYNNRGLAKKNKKDYDGGIEDLTEAIKIEPLEAYYNARGWIKDIQRDDKGAMDDYKEAFSVTNYSDFSKQTFYRFRPLNANTKEGFILNKFFVANPKNFNDPFDASLFQHKYFIERKTLKKFDKNIRIASFASVKDNEACPLKNILLWNYYAQDHKGIAIGYRFNPKKFNQQKAFLKNVDYRKEFVSNSFKNLFAEAYLTKFENWRHEQEWRFVYLKEDDEKDPILLDMTDWGIEIAEIIFGWKCTKHKQKMIYHLFKQKNPNAMPIFYQMERTDADVFELKTEKWECKDL